MRMARKKAKEENPFIFLCVFGDCNIRCINEASERAESGAERDRGERGVRGRLYNKPDLLDNLREKGVELQDRLRGLQRDRGTSRDHVQTHL
jgi:hypothetical protein